MAESSRLTVGQNQIIGKEGELGLTSAFLEGSRARAQLLSWQGRAEHMSGGQRTGRRWLE